MNKHILLYLWDFLDRLQRKHNICNIRTCDGITVCTKGKVSELCCFGCKYLNDNGCTVKSLSCKLWFCEEVLADKELCEKHSEYFSKARKVIAFLDKYNVPLDYREDIINK